MFLCLFIKFWLIAEILDPGINQNSSHIPIYFVHDKWAPLVFRTFITTTSTLYTPSQQHLRYVMWVYIIHFICYRNAILHAGLVFCLFCMILYNSLVVWLYTSTFHAFYPVFLVAAKFYAALWVCISWKWRI